MKTRGVTLIELLVGMSISLILAGITMMSMTVLGRQRLTTETTLLSSDIAWTKQMAATQHYNYFFDFDLNAESYAIYQDTNANGLFDSGTDTRIKQKQLTVDIFCFQDFSYADITPTRIMFASFTGKADRSVYIELRHGGGVREISIFSDTGYGKGSKKGKRGKGRGHRGHGKCFIATAAYSGRDIPGNENGTPEEVRVLEKFRDEYLSANALGREAIALYYTVSPPAAHYIEKREWARKSVRILLKPVVWGARKIVEEK